MPPSMPCAPEDELLLLLVHGRHSPDRDARLRVLLRASPDWTSLLHQARLHGVVPLVAHHLQRLGSREIPPAVTAEFRRLAFLHCGRNLLLARALGAVLRHLMTAHIPVIPLKGVALAHALYGHDVLRVSSDLDLRVRRAQVPHAVHVLEANGCRAEGLWQRWAASPYHMEIPLLPQAGGLRYAVDLHWGLLGGAPRNHGAVEALGAAARPPTVLGVAAWAMRPAWARLFLALHAARSPWQGLQWLVDMQELCWTWARAWPMVWAIAHQWGGGGDRAVDSRGVPSPLGTAPIARRRQRPLALLAAALPRSAAPATVVEPPREVPPAPALGPANQLRAAPHRHVYSNRLPLAPAPGCAVPPLLRPTPPPVGGHRGEVVFLHRAPAAARLMASMAQSRHTTAPRIAHRSQT